MSKEKENCISCNVLVSESNECRGCGYSVCSNCVTSCKLCGFNCCDRCIYTCSNCGESGCSNCTIIYNDKVLCDSCFDIIVESDNPILIGLYKLINIWNNHIARSSLKTISRSVDKINKQYRLKMIRST